MSVSQVTKAEEDECRDAVQALIASEIMTTPNSNDTTLDDKILDSVHRDGGTLSEVDDDEGFDNTPDPDGEKRNGDADVMEEYSVNDDDDDDDEISPYLKRAMAALNETSKPLSEARQAISETYRLLKESDTAIEHYRQTEEGKDQNSVQESQSPVTKQYMNTEQMPESRFDSDVDYQYRNTGDAVSPLFF